MGWLNSFFTNITVTNNISFATGYLSNGDGTFTSTPGLFLYSGTPAAGNLIYTATSNNGSDKFGNNYLQGDTEYDNITGIVVQRISSAINFWFMSSFNPGAVFTLPNAGLGVPFAGANGVSAFVGADGFQIQNNANAPTGVAKYNVTTSNVATVVSPSGDRYATQMSRATAQSAGPVTGTSFSSLYAFGISADDSPTDTGWRITAGGFGTWGSTAQDLTFGLNAFSNDFVSCAIRSQEFPVSTNFDWRVQGEVMVRQRGGAGVIVGCLSVEAGADGVATLSQINSVNSAIGSAGKGSANVDTTVGSSIILRAKWLSTTGAPTMSGSYATLERLGVGPTP